MSKTRLRLWLKLLKVSRLIEDDLRRKLRNEGSWTMPRFDVMAALDRAPDGLKMSDISKRLRVSNGNITGIVDKLTEEGFAERVSLPGDRRAHLVRLTQAGRSRFAELADMHETWIEELLGTIGPGEAEDMMTLLDQLGGGLDHTQGD